MDNKFLIPTKIQLEARKRYLDNPEKYLRDSIPKNKKEKLDRNKNIDNYFISI